MKFPLKIRSLILMFLFLAACNAAPENIQSDIEISTSTSSPIPTLTAQPAQTQTPIPQVIYTPWATKEVLAQFGLFGGDGGWLYGSFIGWNVPKWILYTDGQFIVQKEDNNGVWFEETTLTVSQMCSFLFHIEKSGFFSLEVDNSIQSKYPTDNPILQEFDDTAQFSVGAPSYVLQVNGLKHRQIYIYSDYVQYLIPEARQVFDLFLIILLIHLNLPIIRHNTWYFELKKSMSPRLFNS